MRVFLLDLWLDLREKRLAPLAILLLAGIIAVPVVLAKSEKPAPPPPATATTASAPATPVVQSETTATSSKLQTFSSRDPFEPTSKPTTTPTTTPTTSGGTSTGTSTSPSTSPGTTSPSGGATNGSGPTTTTPPSTGNTGTGNTTGETKTTLFTYTVDVRFGEGGAMKAYRNVQRLDLIPDAQNPKVVFLGVTTTAKTAVFLVDSNVGVDTAGGKCRPSPDQCTFLYLRPDNDHDQAVLTDPDGNVYHLRLLAIHRVTVSSANGQTTTGNSNGNSNGTTRSHAFTGNADKSNSGDAAAPAGETPPGEPNGSASSFQQFFADGADSKTTSGSGSGH